MIPLKIALINEVHTAGATRCAKDLERYLSARHVVRYFPEREKEPTASLLGKLAEFEPDVVHCHSYYGDLPYRFLATVSHRYPTCFTPHDPRPIGTMLPICWECSRANWCFRCHLVGRYRKLLLLNPYFWRRLYKRYIHLSASQTLTIIAPGVWLYTRLLATELSRFDIRSIPCGTDLQRFQPIEHARSILGLPEDNRILLHVAHPVGGWQFDHRKGLQYLADAFLQIILPKYPDTLLLIAGEKVVPNHPNVRPLGFVNQEMLPLYYSAADVFVAPTLADSLTYTVREAMGCETPVVASNVGGMKEGIEDGITGYLVPPADVAALGQALVTILQDRATCHEMGKACRLNVQKIAGMDAFIQQHESLYLEIAKRDTSRGA